MKWLCDDYVYELREKAWGRKVAMAVKGAKGHEYIQIVVFYLPSNPDMVIDLELSTFAALPPFKAATSRIRPR